MKKCIPLFLLLLLIAACAPIPELRDETLLKDTSFVTGDPCAAPCFHGITPGETDWNEAVTILEDTAEFANVQVQPVEGSPEIVAAWEQRDGGACCQMRSLDGEVVGLIFLRTAPNMTLGEAIAEHGEPTYLATQEFTEDQAIISLLYPEELSIIYVFVAGPAEGALQPSSEIIGVLYLIKSQMELLLKTSELHDWEGYQSYSAYVAGDLEITPSVTLTPTPGG